jgi:CRISPR system Cascade subunit CasB
MTTNEQPRMPAKSERRSVGEIALAWWRETIEDSGNDKAKGKSRNRGARAQLRRCSEPTEVFFCPGFHGLLGALRAEDWHNREAAAVIAGVLAHVKDNASGTSFPAQMAAPKAESRTRAVVPGLRFRRLIQAKAREDLHMPLIRVVRLLNGAANVADLADSVFFWGEKVRRDWACSYYSIAPEKEP